MSSDRWLFFLLLRVIVPLNLERLLGNNLIKGTAIDIKENGSLILRTKNETKEVMSGEIISF